MLAFVIRIGNVFNLTTEARLVEAAIVNFRSEV